MKAPKILRPLAAEGLGTAGLLMAVVGSGIMAERLSQGNLALALWANTAATGAALVALILTFGQLSGAHFNPVVTLVAALRREMGPAHALAYMLAQTAGALVGVALAHAMFAAPLISAYGTPRTGAGVWLGEFVATFGLVGIVLGLKDSKPNAVPYAVGLYISAAYWFTSSTSFANPAVTLARGLTASFSGIRLTDVPAFIAMQILGGLGAALIFGWLLRSGLRPMEARPHS